MSNKGKGDLPFASCTIDGGNAIFIESNGFATVARTPSGDAAGDYTVTMAEGYELGANAARFCVHPDVTSAAWSATAPVLCKAFPSADGLSVRIRVTNLTAAVNGSTVSLVIWPAASPQNV